LDIKNIINNMETIIFLSLIAIAACGIATLVILVKKSRGERPQMDEETLRRLLREQAAETARQIQQVREELTRTLRKFEPDQTVSVTVYRAGKQVTLQVTLDEKPRDIVAAQPAQRYPMPGDEGFEEWYRQFMEEYFG
jgi:hypothetical protein